MARSRGCIVLSSLRSASLGFPPPLPRMGETVPPARVKTRRRAAPAPPLPQRERGQRPSGGRDETAPQAPWTIRRSEVGSTVPAPGRHARRSATAEDVRAETPAAAERRRTAPSSRPAHRRSRMRRNRSSSPSRGPRISPAPPTRWHGVRHAHRPRRSQDDARDTAHVRRPPPDGRASRLPCAPLQRRCRSRRGSAPDTTAVAAGRRRRTCGQRYRIAGCGACTGVAPPCTTCEGRACSAAADLRIR